MLEQKINLLLKPNILRTRRFLSCTNALCLIQKWRKERGLPLNPNTNGVLTNGPDYTFLNGRLTPYGIGQKRRLIKQKEHLLNILSLSNEIDFAVARYKNIQVEKENQKKEILDKKLKAKGLELLKRKK